MSLCLSVCVLATYIRLNFDSDLDHHVETTKIIWFFPFTYYHMPWQTYVLIMSSCYMYFILLCYFQCQPHTSIKNSFITFSLLINDLILLLNGVALILSLYIHFKVLFALLVCQRSKLHFYVRFNSQVYTGTGPQYCHLWKSNWHRGDSLWLDGKPADQVGYRGPLFDLCIT